jgi:hypothetical protein
MKACPAKVVRGQWLGQCGAIAAYWFHALGYDHVPGDVLHLDHGNGNSSAICRRWTGNGQRVTVSIAHNAAGFRGFKIASVTATRKDS